MLSSKNEKVQIDAYGFAEIEFEKNQLLNTANDRSNRQTSSKIVKQTRIVTQSIETQNEVDAHLPQNNDTILELTIVSSEQY